jgi:hypothetical protein
MLTERKVMQDILQHLILRGKTFDGGRSAEAGKLDPLFMPTK